MCPAACMHTHTLRGCMLTYLSTLVCVCVCVKAFDKHDLLRCSDGSMKSAADVAPLQSLPCVAEGTPADEAALAGATRGVRVNNPVNSILITLRRYSALFPFDNEHLYSRAHQGP